MARTFRRTVGWSPRDRQTPDSPLLTLIGSIFAVIGLGLAVAAVILFARTRGFVDRAATAAGEVITLIRRTDGDRISFRPLVRFRTPAGKSVEFLATTASDPPSYEPGDRVEVLYDPARPLNASIRSFFELWGVPLILGSLGAMFTPIGLGLLALRVREKLARSAQARAAEERAGLAQFGRKVEATIREVRSEPGDTYRVVAQWLDPGTRSVYVFESAPIGYDPASYLGSTIPVFVDPNDPAQYLVDLSGLPSLGNPAEGAA